jgi:hypothetical protein
MITVEMLQAVTDVVTHDHCSDGAATAILLLDALPGVNIHFLQHNTDEYRTFPVGPNQLWCDITPPYKKDCNRTQEFVAAGAIVLDHHKGTEEVVAQYGERGVFADEVKEPGVSGASLAFREVWLKMKTSAGADEIAEARHFAKLAGVRDTFQTHDPFWIQACEQAEALRFMPFNTWMIEDPFVVENLGWWRDRRFLGRILVQKHQNHVDRAIRGAHRFTTKRGTRVVLFPGNGGITSDAAETVGSSADLVSGFSYVGLEDGLAKIVFSIRSHAGYDCLKFSSAMGGGGHTKAAGFAVSFSPTVGDRDPFTLFAHALERHEAHEPAQAVQP